MKISAYTLTFILSVASLTNASGISSVGGGGDVVVLPNDDVILADAFLNHKALQPGATGRERTLNPRLAQTIGSYKSVLEGLFAKISLKNSQVLGEMERLSNNRSSLRFHAVQNATELNILCNSGGSKSYELPENSKIAQIACTDDNQNTFFIEPLFLKMDLRHQALLLIHERLTTLKDRYGNRNYSAIARFTSGLDLYLDVTKQHQQEQPIYLSNQQAENITAMMHASVELEKRNSSIDANDFAWFIHPNGAGLKHMNARIADSAYLGFTSRAEAGVFMAVGSYADEVYLKKDSRLGKNARIEQIANQSKNNFWIVRAHFDLGADAELKEIIIKTVFPNPDVFSIYIGDKSKVINNTFSDFFAEFNFPGLESQRGRSIIIGSNTTVTKSKTESSELQIGNNNQINRTYIGLGVDRLGNGLFFNEASINPYKGEAIIDNQRIENGIITDLSEFYLPISEKTVSFRSHVTHIKKVTADWKQPLPSSKTTNCSNEYMDCKATTTHTLNRTSRLLKKYELVSTTKIEFSIKEVQNTDPELYVLRNGKTSPAGAKFMFLYNSDNDFEDAVYAALYDQGVAVTTFRSDKVIIFPTMNK